MSATRPWLLRWSSCVALGVALTLCLPRAARAYVLDGTHWPSDQPLVLNLQLTALPNTTLSDGTTSWNQVAVAAMNVWNPYLGGTIQFQANQDVFAPSQGDGRNSVFFSGTAYGESLGSDTLAVTLSLHNSTTNIKTEADVIVNQVWGFDSYRGAQEYNSSDVPIIDLRRVLIHEFGHVLGLLHVPQGNTSIMTPYISDLDTVQADDIAGVTAIYGASVHPPVLTGASVSQGAINAAFSYAITANGNVTRYGATGLPAGLTVNTTTGLISGTPTAAGTFTATITASNSYGTASAPLTLHILGVPTITSPLTLAVTVGQTFLYQFTASGSPTSFDTFTGLSTELTYDYNAHVLSGTYTTPGVYTYLLTAGNAVGSVTQTLTINCSADTGLLTLHAFAGVEGIWPGAPLVQATDGNFYGTTCRGGLGGGGTIYRMTPAGVVTLLYNFQAEGGFNAGALLTAGSDGNLYGSTTGADGDFSKGMLFKITPAGDFTPLHSFDGADGAGMASALVRGIDGAFYGVVGYDTGTETGELLFRITSDGAYSAIQRLPKGATNNYLSSSLFQSADGTFYVSAPEDGPASAGTITRVRADGTVTVLHTFSGPDGDGPSGLVAGGDGNFYGTTSGGNGAGKGGTFFRLTPDGTLTTLHVFNGTSEGSQTTAIVPGANGFYGTTTRNGIGNAGVLFQVTTAGRVTVLHSFTAVDGSVNGPLCLGRDGHLYGFTYGEGLIGANYTYNNVNGSIFRTTTETAATTPTYVSVSAGSQASVGQPGTFTLTRVGIDFTSALLVNMWYGGTAVAGTDYTMLPANISIPAGAASVTVNVNAINAALGTSSHALDIHVGDHAGYTANPATRVAHMAIYGNLPVVYTTHPFFTNQVALSNGVYYLDDIGGSSRVFGYYSYLTDRHYIYHFDMGYEYVFDTSDIDSGVYFYDFASGTFFYTAPSIPLGFPYLYDFSLQAVLYYYPNPSNPQHYNTNGVRYFYNFSTGKIITK